MSKNSSERTAKVYRDGKWVKTPFQDLKIGDRFRLYEDTGEIVVDGKGQIEWICTSNPYLDVDDVLTVDIE